MLRLIAGWIILFSMLTSYGQDNNLAPLKIGDKLPVSYLSNASYYSNAGYGSNSSKPKLTILDFWGVHCTTCIKEMREVQEYQSKLGDRIQIYLVTRDNKTDLDLLYNKTKLFRDVNLPIIYQDNALSQLFPYNAYGLHVWLDSNGKVAKKTESLSYSIGDIEKFISNINVEMVGRDDKHDFNRDQWIAAEGNGRQQKNIQYYSVVSSRIFDYGGSLEHVESDPITHKPTYIRTFNKTITHLLLTAFTESRQRTIYKTIYKTNDSSKYFPPHGELASKWRREHEYCYELKVPTEKSKYFFKYMQSDLERFFDLTANVRKCRIPVLELCLVGKGKNIKTHGGKGMEQYPVIEDSLVLTNVPISSLVDAAGTLLGFPAFDETNIQDNIDVSVTDPHESIAEFNTQLLAYGLKLKMKRKRLPVLIVGDRK